MHQTSHADRWLLALRVVVLVSVVVNVPHLRSPEAERMREIASSPGRPYRDFDVEYPVGELVLIEGVGAASTDVARIALALIAFGADLLACAAVRSGWGRSAATRYLFYGAPLLVFIYRRSDLLAVALAVGALSLARRDRERAGGIAMGAAILVKIWPVVILPIWVIGRRLRSLAAMAATVVVGGIVWLAIGGPSALGQVTSFRGATGWELESTVGAVIWAATDAYRFESGANRTGFVPGWSRVLLLILTVGGLALIWWRARARAVDPAGAPALAAVALLLVVSPLLSPQYLCWLVPWVAIAASDAPRVSRWGVVPICLTGALMAAWFTGLTQGHPGWSQGALILRNASLVAIPVVWLWDARTRARDPAG